MTPGTRRRSRRRPKRRRAVSQIAPGVAVSAVVADLDHRNARELLSGTMLVFDASDNFETRLLVSDAARALGLPSIYAGCVGSEGLVAVSVPGRTPCLRCYLEAFPPAGDGPTCDTAGIVPTLPPLMAAAGHDRGAAARRRAGAEPRNLAGGGLERSGLSGAGSSRPRAPRSDARSARGPDSRRSKERAPGGRQALRPAIRAGGAGGRERPDFDALEKRSGAHRPVHRSPQLLSAEVEGVHLTLFSDGRCVVRGTEDPERRGASTRSTWGGRRPGRLSVPMRRVSIDDLTASREETFRLRELLGNGGVVALPTETFYGLAADPWSEAGVRRICAMKGRDDVKALPVLFGSRAHLDRLAIEAPPRVLDSYFQIWPAPLTVVFAIRQPIAASRGVKKLGVRLPADRKLRDLLQTIGPVTGTSVEPLREPAARRSRTPSRRCFDGKSTGSWTAERLPAESPRRWSTRRRSRQPFCARARTCGCARSSRFASGSVLDCALSWA